MRIFSMIECLLLLVASLSGQQAGVQGKAQTAEAVRGFVQGFYSWYVPQTLKTEETPA